MQAVWRHVPKLPPPGPEEPGPFAFASEARVHRILGEAGFSDIAMEPCQLTLDVAVGRGLDAAVEAVARNRPGQPCIRRSPRRGAGGCEELGPRGALAFVSGQTVPLGGSIWIVTAQAS